MSTGGLGKGTGNTGVVSGGQSGTGGLKTGGATGVGGGVGVGGLSAGGGVGTGGFAAGGGVGTGGVSVGGSVGVGGFFAGGSAGTGGWIFTDGGAVGFGGFFTGGSVGTGGSLGTGGMPGGQPCGYGSAIGLCMQYAAIPSYYAQYLPQDSCTDPNELCVPIEKAFDFSYYFPTCSGYWGSNSACMPQYMFDFVSTTDPWLQYSDQGTCNVGYICTPCMGPYYGYTTGACE
jgi:hypothetical protein